MLYVIPSTYHWVFHLKRLTQMQFILLVSTTLGLFQSMLYKKLELITPLKHLLILDKPSFNCRIFAYAITMIYGRYQMRYKTEYKPE